MPVSEWPPRRCWWWEVQKAIMNIRGTCRVNSNGKSADWVPGHSVLLFNTDQPSRGIHKRNRERWRTRRTRGKRMRMRMRFPASICSSVSSWLNCVATGSGCDGNQWPAEGVAMQFPREMQFYGWELCLHRMLCKNACLWLSALLSNNYRSTFEPIPNKSLSGPIHTSTGIQQSN